MESTKKPWQSLTLRGWLVLLLGLLAQHFGFDIDPETVSQEMMKMIAIIIDGVGLAMVAFGRFRADKKVSF